MANCNNCNAKSFKNLKQAEERLQRLCDSFSLTHRGSLELRLDCEEEFPTMLYIYQNGGKTDLIKRFLGLFGAFCHYGTVDNCQSAIEGELACHDPLTTKMIFDLFGNLWQMSRADLANKLSGYYSENDFDFLSNTILSEHNVFSSFCKCVRAKSWGLKDGKETPYYLSHKQGCETHYFESQHKLLASLKTHCLLGGAEFCKRLVGIYSTDLGFVCEKIRQSTLTLITLALPEIYYTSLVTNNPNICYKQPVSTEKKESVETFDKDVSGIEEEEEETLRKESDSSEVSVLKKRKTEAIDT